jgi:phasin family protein
VLCAVAPIALDHPRCERHYKTRAAHKAPLPSRKADEIMAKTETNTSGFFDVAKVFGDFCFPGIDVDTVVATHRKNVEALTQTNQLAVEGIQALVRRQTEIVRQAIDQASGLVRDWMQPGAPEERLANTADAARQAFETSVANVRELNELTTKASTDMFGVIAKRVSESFDEVQRYAKKHTSAA